MFKRKIKNNLIGEYIEICKINKFCSYYADNSSFDKILNKTDSLKRKYERILFRVGSIDLSFFILMKDINKNSNIACFDENKAKNMLYDFKKSVYNYEIKLGLKMKKLMLNEFEINFIENFG